MALTHNFSTQISNLEKLKEIAASPGFVNSRSAKKVKAVIRQMLEAIIDGEATVTPIEPEKCEMDEAYRRDLEIQHALLADGLISEIKPLDKRQLSPFRPVTVEGEPVSKMIIRERR